MSSAPDCAVLAFRLRSGHLIFLGAEPFVQFRLPTPPRYGKHQKVWGNQAAHGSASTDPAPAFSRIPPLELPRSVPSRVRVRTCSMRCAPQFLVLSFMHEQSGWSWPYRHFADATGDWVCHSHDLAVRRPWATRTAVFGRRSRSYHRRASATIAPSLKAWPRTTASTMAWAAPWPV